MRETPKAAAAYAEYAAMGPSRSLAKLYEQLRQSNGKTTVPLRTLEAWSTAHNWQERVREHDAAIIAENEARRLAAIDAMNERQATIGTTHQKRAIDQIGRLIESGKFGSQAAVMLLKLAIDVERTARDAPTAIERHEQTGKDGGPIAVTADARALLAAKLAAQSASGRTRADDSQPDA